MESISISTLNTGPVAFGGFLLENKGSKPKNVSLQGRGRRAATKCPEGTCRGHMGDGRSTQKEHVYVLKTTWSEGSEEVLANGKELKEVRKKAQSPRLRTPGNIYG